jgi:hypothetical protein
MNVWYGRGGLNVKVGEFDCFVNNFVEVVQLPKEFSCLPRLPGLIELRFATTSGPSGGNLHEFCRLEDVDRLPVTPKCFQALNGRAFPIFDILISDPPMPRSYTPRNIPR